MKLPLHYLYFTICSLTTFFSSCSNDEDNSTIIEQENPAEEVITKDGFTTTDTSTILPKTTFGNEEDCKLTENDQFNAIFLNLINSYRHKKGLNKLAPSTIADYLAFKHTKHMICNADFRKGNSIEISKIIIKNTGSDTVGLNIITGHNSPQRVLKKWLKESGYIKHIENPQFTHTGFSAIKDDNGRYWATQNFYK